DVADRDLAVESLAGTSVEDGHLARMLQPREVKHLLDVGLLGAVEYRRCDRHAVTQVATELDQLALTQGLDRLILAVDLLEHVLERARVVLGVVCVHRLPDLQAETRAGPSQMRLQNLADIHAAWHAERIKDDVHLLAV